MTTEAQCTAILTAVEEVALGTLGVIRTMVAAELARDAYAGMDTRTLAERVIVKPRVEVALVSLGRSKAVAPATASTQLEELELKITLAFTTQMETREDQRRATRAAAMSMGSRLAQALTWPGNLLQTAAGALTGLVSRCLYSVGPAKVVREDYKKRVFVVEMAGRGRVLSSAAVT